MSEYVYTDKKSNVTESQWKKWENQEKLGYLESLIGYKIYNGENLNYDWDGCPVSETAGILDPSGDPYIIVNYPIQYIKFKATGSTSTNTKEILPQSDNPNRFKLTGRLYFGEVSFIIQTENLYQWNNGNDQVDELNIGFGFILDDSIETKKAFPSANDDIYLINTQNFKIQDKKICVYGKTGANEVDSGNYTYNYEFNYGYAKGRNYYAWGKNQVQVIPLWTNEFGDEVDEGKGIVVNDQHVLIYLKENEKPISYDLPRNSKVVICKRTAAANITWDGYYLNHSIEPIGISYYTCTVSYNSPRYTAKTSLSLITENTQVPSSTLSFNRSNNDNRYFLSTDGKTYTSYKSPKGWNKGFGFENDDFNKSDYIQAREMEETSKTNSSKHASTTIHIEENTTNHSFKTEGLYRSSLFNSTDLQFKMENPIPTIIADVGFSYINIHSITKIAVSGILDVFLQEKSWLKDKNKKSTLEYDGIKYPYYTMTKFDNNDSQAAIYASTQIQSERPYPCYWVFIVPKDFEVVPKSA